MLASKGNSFTKTYCLFYRSAPVSCLVCSKVEGVEINKILIFILKEMNENNTNISSISIALIKVGTILIHCKCKVYNIYNVTNVTDECYQMHYASKNNHCMF